MKIPLVEARYPDDLVIEFLYDGFGRRVITRVNGEGVRHIYDGYLIVQDRKERTDELVAEYTYFQGNIFKIKRGTTERWVYNYPEGGWPRHLFDNEGTRTDSLDMGWFGDVAYRYGTSDIGIGWSGGWTFAYDTAMPFVFIAETNEIWLPKIGKRLNPIVRHSSTVNLMDSAWLGPTTPSKCDETSPTRGPVIHVGGTIRLSDSKCVSPFWKWFRKLCPRRARPSCADTKPKTPIPPGDTGDGDGDGDENGDDWRKRLHDGILEPGMSPPHKITDPVPDYKKPGYEEAQGKVCPYVDSFHPNQKCWPHPRVDEQTPFHKEWNTLIASWPQEKFYAGEYRESCNRIEPTKSLFLDVSIAKCRFHLEPEDNDKLIYTSPLCISMPPDVCFGRARAYWYYILYGSEALNKEKPPFSPIIPGLPETEEQRRSWAPMNYLFRIFQMVCRDNFGTSKLRYPDWNPLYVELYMRGSRYLFSQCVMDDLQQQFSSQCG